MSIVEDINKLKKEKNTVILAHYYVRPEVQDVADYIGDSFYLSKVAANAKEDTIVFCGVSFMGESAKMLSPEKTVLMPDMSADCPMAHMADAETIQKIRDTYDDLAVVCYINSTAELKRYSDVCVTSSNAVKIVKNLPNKNIFFIPDRNLAHFIAEQVPEKNFIYNEGFCPTHERMQAEEVQELKEKDTNTLLAEGYSISDIERAKSGELERTILNELMERSTLSDEILARKGYTANEIAELRSLTGNESLYSVRGLLASVTVKNTKNSYYYKSSADRTYFLIDVSWSWDKEPAVHWTDIAGAGWDGNYELTKHISSTNNRLSLTCVGNGPAIADKTVYAYMTSSDINAGKATFAMNQGAYYVQSFYWVKSGSGRIELSIVGHDNNAEFIFKYGHATLSTSPSVSLGGLSLSFSSGIDTFTPSTGAVYGGRATIK